MGKEYLNKSQNTDLVESKCPLSSQISYHHKDCKRIVENKKSSYSYKCINLRKKIKSAEKSPIKISNPNTTNIGNIHKEALSNIAKIIDTSHKKAKLIDPNSKLPFILENMLFTSRNATLDNKSSFRYSQSQYALGYLLNTFGGKKIISIINGIKGKEVDINNLVMNLPTSKSIKNRIPNPPTKTGMENEDTLRVIKGIKMEDRANKLFNLSIDEAKLNYGLAFRNGILYGFERPVYQKDIGTFMSKVILQSMILYFKLKYILVQG